MVPKTGFAPLSPLRGSHACKAHSAQFRRHREVRRSASETPDSGAFLLLGLLIAIALGLIGLRAAIWLPPLNL